MIITILCPVVVAVMNYTFRAGTLKSIPSGIVDTRGGANVSLPSSFSLSLSLVRQYPWCCQRRSCWTVPTSFGPHSSAMPCHLLLQYRYGMFVSQYGLLASVFANSPHGRWNQVCRVGLGLHGFASTIQAGLCSSVCSTSAALIRHNLPSPCLPRASPSLRGLPNKPIRTKSHRYSYAVSQMAVPAPVGTSKLPFLIANGSWRRSVFSRIKIPLLLLPPPGAKNIAIRLNLQSVSSGLIPTTSRARSLPWDILIPYNLYRGLR